MIVITTDLICPSPSAAGLFTGKATKNVSQDALAGSRFDGTVCVFFLSHTLYKLNG